MSSHEVCIFGRRYFFWARPIRLWIFRTRGNFLTTFSCADLKCSPAGGMRNDFSLQCTIFVVCVKCPN
jgi:hypothetical protein